MAQQTRTTTRPQQRQQTQQPQPDTSKGQLAVLPPPRIPMPPANVLSEYKMNEHGWRTLVEATFSAAKTAHAVIMAMDYCMRRKLDIFKHPMHIVPIWDNQKRQFIETIWPGINELRTTAQRTGQYAGMDVPEFGPTIEKTFEGRIKAGDAWEDKKITMKFPEWCRITVYRKLGNDRVPFPGPRVSWLETYSRINNFCEVPNAMWAKRPEGQLEKCAEAAALRRAFPEEIGSDYTIDEFYSDDARSAREIEATVTHEAREPEPEPTRADFNKPAAAETPKQEVETTKEKPKPADKKPEKPVTDVVDQNDKGPPPAEQGDPGASDPRGEDPKQPGPPNEPMSKGDLDESAEPAGEERQPPVFNEYTRIGDFFIFADSWIVDESRTEAELVAFSAFYNKFIQERLSPDYKNERVRDAMKDTMRVYQECLALAQKRAKA